MITEDYCSFEVSKLLKEKSFDEPCRAYWDDQPVLNSRTLFWTVEPHKHYGKEVSAPTYQMAMKWLRETHKLFIEIHIEQGKKVSYKFMIWDFYIIHPNKYVGGTYDFREEQNGFSTPEQAVEAALKYSLENLI